MPDLFDTHRPDLSAPADIAFNVTPSDSLDLPIASRGLYVGGAGNLAVTTTAGYNATFADVPAGSIIPLRAARVRATGTTATGIVALA